MHADSPSHATLTVSSLVIVGLLAGAVTGSAAVARVQDPYAHLDLFARVLSTVQQDYVEDIPSDRLIEAAIRGIMDDLDEHSRWLSADQLQGLRDDADGATTGIGVEVKPAEGGVEVTRVLPDSPAGRDGLLPGDRIIAIDTTPLEGLDAKGLRDAFRGLRGETAHLTVLREGRETALELSTTRDKIPTSALNVALIDRVVYARLEHFQAGSSVDLLDQTTAAAAELGGLSQVDGLLLDLRDNPGGLLTEAIAVSDLFLDEGVIVSTKGRGTADERYEATPGGFPPELPVVVLINGQSASASEIVASALQDTQRAKLVGEKTYGKGTVQKVYTHLDPRRADHAEAALKLTIGRYYTPSGQPVATREGREPDLLVPWPRGPNAQQELVTRLRALEVAEEEREALVSLAQRLQVPPSKEQGIAWTVSPKERAATDVQISAALAILTE